MSTKFTVFHRGHNYAVTFYSEREAYLEAIRLVAPTQGGYQQLTDEQLKDEFLKIDEELRAPINIEEETRGSDKFTAFGPDGLMEGYRTKKEALLRALDWAGDDMAESEDLSDEDLEERLSQIIDTTGEAISVKVTY